MIKFLSSENDKYAEPQFSDTERDDVYELPSSYSIIIRKVYSNPYEEAVRQNFQSQSSSESTPGRENNTRDCLNIPLRSGANSIVEE